MSMNIGYCRVSTGKQDVSLDAQEEKIRAMAVVHGIEISEVIVDNDESAKDLNRPGVKRLMELIRAGSVRCLIVAKLDRITRDVGDLQRLIKLFAKHRTKFVSVEESLDSSSAAGELVINLMTSVSHWERRAIGERTKTALQHLKGVGFRVGKTPYGWTAPVRSDEDRKAGIRHRLQPVESEQKIIEYIRKCRSAKMSFQSIANVLNSHGYTTRQGTPWVHQYVRNAIAEGKKVIAA